MFGSLISRQLIDSPLVEAKKYLSWERYYTDLLMTVGKLKTDCSYSKTSLGKAYYSQSFISRILGVYGLPFTTVEPTSVFRSEE